MTQKQRIIKSAGFTCVTAYTTALVPAPHAESGSLGGSPAESLVNPSFCIPSIKKSSPHFFTQGLPSPEPCLSNKVSFSKLEHFSSLTAKLIKSSQRKVRQTQPHLPASHKRTDSPIPVFPFPFSGLRKILTSGTIL